MLRFSVFGRGAIVLFGTSFASSLSVRFLNAEQTMSLKEFRNCSISCRKVVSLKRTYACFVGTEDALVQRFLQLHEEQKRLWIQHYTLTKSCLSELNL